jgi:cobalamin-dependent methionine synthase I
MIAEEDLPGLQALAVRQVEAGSRFIDVTIGPRAYEDLKFLQKVVRALQEAITVPLCIDYPVKHIVAACLEVYDVKKSGGIPPLINSFAETRMDMCDLFDIMPCKVVLMTHEYIDANGSPKGCKKPDDIVAVARRLVQKLVNEYGLKRDDIFVDVTINSVISDMEGLTKMALTAIQAINTDPDTRGVHIMGGLTNIGNMLPKIEFSGMSLRHSMENAFLTRAVPLGFDTVLGTPWTDFSPLPEGHPVLVAFDELLELKGLDAMRRLRKLWAK